MPNITELEAMYPDRGDMRPRVEFFGRVYDEEMGDMSGFGGGYEAACRVMVLAGADFLDKHPGFRVSAQEIEQVFGIVDAKDSMTAELMKAMNAAVGNTATGAMMHQAVLHVAWINGRGWDAYVAEMKKPVEPSDGD